MKQVDRQDFPGLPASRSDIKQRSLSMCQGDAGGRSRELGVWSGVGAEICGASPVL